MGNKTSRLRKSTQKKQGPHPTQQVQDPQSLHPRQDPQRSEQRFYPSQQEQGPQQQLGDATTPVSLNLSHLCMFLMFFIFFGIYILKNF